MVDIKKIEGFENAGGYFLEFDGEQVFLPVDEIETHLTKYFKIREQLKRDKRLRKQNSTLQDAWDKYQAILALTR